MTTIDPRKPVLVTGATGYLASWIVKDLLDAGRTVHGTVRDPNNQTAVKHLHEIAAKAPGKLRLFRADLTEPSSFDAAAAACELVMHTASPFPFGRVADPEGQLLRPAVEGTRNVLTTVNRTKSVKRVVLTSSIMAIYGDSQDSQQAPHGKFDESYWNSSSSLSYQPYPYSKVMAEREAWRIHDAPDNHGWSMVALNPALILGPSLTPHTRSGSIPVLTTLASIRARLGVPNVVAPLVDVRDVARAHLLAGDNSAASGRNILVAESVTLLQIAAHLRAGFPEHGFPSRELPKWLAWLIGPMAGLERRFVSRNVGYPVTLDNARSRRELGMSYRPLAHTLCEHFQQLIDDGLVEAKPARQGASAAAPVDNRASN